MIKIIHLHGHYWFPDSWGPPFNFFLGYDNFCSTNIYSLNVNSVPTCVFGFQKLQHLSVRCNKSFFLFSIGFNFSLITGRWHNSLRICIALVTALNWKFFLRVVAGGDAKRAVQALDCTWHHMYADCDTIIQDCIRLASQFSLSFFPV